MKLIKWISGLFWSKPEQQQPLVQQDIPDEITWEYLSGNFMVEESPFLEDELEDIVDEGRWNEVLRSRLELSFLATLPFHLRRRLWLQIAGVDQLKDRNPVSYENLALMGNSHTSRIKKDINRTLCEQRYFDGKRAQTQLFRILQAYSNLDPETGYVQGLNFLAGGLLMLLDIKVNEQEEDLIVIDNQVEEQVFWLLVFIMQRKNLRRNFGLRLEGLFECTNELAKRVKQTLPRLAARFESIGIEYSTCFCREYLTLGLVNFQKKLSAKVLDLYLMGSIHVVTGLILKGLQVSEKQLLRMQVQDVMMFVKDNMWSRISSWASQTLSPADIAALK